MNINKLSNDDGYVLLNMNSKNTKSTYSFIH